MKHRRTEREGEGLNYINQHGSRERGRYEIQDREREDMNRINQEKQRDKE